jgi:hypothetical protein
VLLLLFLIPPDISATMNSDDDSEEEEFGHDEQDKVKRDGNSSRRRVPSDSDSKSSENDDDETGSRDDNAGKWRPQKRKGTTREKDRRQSTRRVTQDGRSSRQHASQPPPGQNVEEATRTPGIAVAMVAAETRLRAVLGEGNNVHYGESLQVKNYVRHFIYPKKKTFFSDKDYRYGSALANTVIDFILYNKKGHYKMKPEVDEAVKAGVDMAFWARVMDSVRKVLKEKLNNSISRFREKFESKSKTIL